MYAGTGFVGAGSGGQRFYKDADYTLDGAVWENGDEITLRLDCENHTLDIYRCNMYQATLEVPDGRLYPWASISAAGQAVTILSYVRILARED